MDAVVIQCCASKRDDAGTFKLLNGDKVYFVARPDRCPVKKGVAYFRPDDVNPDTGYTWREYLKNYNRQHSNPDKLLKASNLYKPKIYQLLAENSRWETYILSAGWGLIKADYLLPSYDITFSSNIKDKWKIRDRKDKYYDFNHLRTKENDTIYFFGGMDYVEPFYEFTRSLRTNVVIYFRNKNIKRQDSYRYVPYRKRIRTNWHYKCAKDFINGRIQK
ncbi:MAG: hypothetical protein FJ240_09075 [Nitrospira sp.]|nr:hypothetical protein [Nitrospira sp.]